MKAVAIAPGFARANVRQQPWCYVHRVWRHLPDHGIHGVVVSDGYPRLPPWEGIEGIRVRHVPSVRGVPGVRNRRLRRVLRSLQPDVVLWNLGLTSLFHLTATGLDGVPQVALFTSPTYRLSDVLRMGLRRVASNFRHLYVHLLATTVPRLLLSRVVERAGFDAFIVLTSEAKQALTTLGVPPERIHLVSPGVDDEWLDATVNHGSVAELRRKIGVGEDGFLVLYLGSPSPLRGPDVAIRAAAEARTRAPQTRLVLLCRRWPGEYAADERHLRQLARGSPQDGAVRLLSGYLSPEDVRRWVAAADLVALPFRLVPSDAPLSLLEAAAAGKPIVTTAVDGIPSLLPNDAVRLVPPDEPRALAKAILEVAACGRSRGFPDGPYWHRGWREVATDVAAILQEVVKNG